MTLPGWVGVREPRGRLGGLYAKNVTICPTQACTTPNLGALLLAKGDFAAAEPLLREALEGLRETLGNRHADTLSSMNNLGMLLEDKGDLAAAEPLLREALEG